MRTFLAAATLAGVALSSGTALAAPDPLRDMQWYLDTIGADRAQTVTQGGGVTVAVVDSGVDADHPDLAGSVIKGPDLVGHDDDPNDENGHGTAVAGIIAAHARNGIGIAGAAPDVKILAVRVLDAKAEGSTTVEAKGIDAAVAGGAKVINLSLGTDSGVAAKLGPDDDLVQAIDRAGDAGVVVVASAGNQGKPACAQPVLQTRIICVGAVTRQKKLAAYSNYGLRVDLVAPGGDFDTPDGSIVSTGKDNGYVELAGTSEAAPQVAATAALLVAQGLTASQVIDRIEDTADDLGQLGPDFVYGHGMLDMAAALGVGASSAAPAPPLPIATQAAHRASTRVTCRARRRIARTTLLRHGLRVRCHVPSTQRSRIVLETADGRRLGQAVRASRGDARRTFVVRLSASGRRIVRRSPSGAVLCRVVVRGGGATVVRLRPAR